MNIIEFSKTIGVSKGTIWRALNNKTDISEGTRAMVLAKAQEMGYQPNRAASSLVTGKSKLISLIMPELTTTYDMMIVRALQKYIMGAGFNLVIRDMGPPEMWDQQIDQCLQWPVDGMIILDSAEWIPKLRKYPQFASTAFVSIGAFVEQTGDYVHVDLEKATIDAIRHLAGKGYQRIAYVVPESYDSDTSPRCRAYKKAMREADLCTDHIRTEQQSRNCAYLSMNTRIEQGEVPQALLCFNDAVAMGVYRALHEHGLKVPEDVAVVGCDGIEDTEYMCPALTTIVQPVDEMCSIAWDYLLNRMNKPELPVQHTTLCTKLVVRSST